MDSTNEDNTDLIKGSLAPVVAVVETYDRLTSTREHYLDRARLNAKLTIPALMPPQALTQGGDLYIPYQSIGAQGVNTMAEKIVDAMLPTNLPIHRTVVDDKALEDLSGDPTARAEVEAKLSSRDRAIQAEIEGMMIRAQFGEAVRQLLVSGNVLVVVPDQGNARVYRLDKYVVQRAPDGTVLNVIIKESVPFELLPDEVQEALKENHADKLTKDSRGVVEGDQPIALYTRYWRKGKKMETQQYAYNVPIPGTDGRWPLEESPVFALRMAYVDGEHYGRAYVDEYIGDLTAAEGLSRSIVEASAAAAKVVVMVKPNGLTKAKDVANAKNLDVITGLKDDVTMLTLDKFADLRVTQETLREISQRLSRAFLMASSVQRNAERVTAEEIRAMVSELESVLGGFYALMTTEFQLKFVQRVVYRMERAKTIAKLSAIKGPNGKPITGLKIVAGLAALGRGQDLENLRGFIQDIAMVAQAEQLIGKDIHVGDLYLRLANGRNIDPKGLLKTPEEKQADLEVIQAQQQQQLAQQTMAEGAKAAVGPAINALSKQQMPEQAA